MSWRADWAIEEVCGQLELQKEDLATRKRKKEREKERKRKRKKERILACRLFFFNGKRSHEVCSFEPG